MKRHISKDWDKFQKDSLELAAENVHNVKEINK
jgi:hypothetical protein